MYTLTVWFWNTEDGSPPEGKNPWDYMAPPPIEGFNRASQLAYWMKKHHRGDDEDGDRPYFKVVAKSDLKQAGIKDEWFALAVPESGPPRRKVSRGNLRR